MQKSNLRREMIAKRTSLNHHDVERKSAAIAKRVGTLLDWKNVRSIHIYRAHPSWREVDTAWLAPHISKRWPHIEITIGDVAKVTALPEEQYDVIIVPLVAFDARSHRIGLGGGWYDRFIASQPDAMTIGLAYDFQQVPQVPLEPHDMVLHHIVTESRTFTK